MALISPSAASESARAVLVSERSARPRSSRCEPTTIQVVKRTSGQDGQRRQDDEVPAERHGPADRGQRGGHPLEALGQ